MTPAEFKQARQSLGLGQIALGALIGYGQPHISGWETGKNQIPPVVIIAMLAMQRLGLPTDWPA